MLWKVRNNTLYPIKEELNEDKDETIDFSSVANTNKVALEIVNSFTVDVPQSI